MNIFYLSCLFFVSSAVAMQQQPNNDQNNGKNQPSRLETQKIDKAPAEQEKGEPFNPHGFTPEQIQHNYTTVWAYRLHGCVHSKKPKK